MSKVLSSPYAIFKSGGNFEGELSNQGHKIFPRKTCIFDGSAGSITIKQGDGFSSITDSGTGNYRCNYDGNFASADHIILATCRRFVGTANMAAACLGATPTVGYADINTVYTVQATGVGTLFDSTYICVSAEGALA